MVILIQEFYYLPNINIKLQKYNINSIISLSHAAFYLFFGVLPCDPFIFEPTEEFQLLILLNLSGMRNLTTMDFLQALVQKVGLCEN